MTVGRMILLGLLGLVVAEAAVFLLIAHLFGWFVALFTLLATSVVGFLVLGRMGKRLLGRLADMVSRQGPAVIETGSGGVLTMLGGILLVLPGFITDVVGLLLLIPAIQRRIVRRHERRQRHRSSRPVLQLDRSQWRDLPDRLTDESHSGPRKKMPRR